MSLSDAIEKKKQQKGAAGSIASSAPSVNMESRFDQAIQIKKAGGSISSIPKVTPVSTKPEDNSVAKPQTVQQIQPTVTIAGYNKSKFSFGQAVANVAERGLQGIAQMGGNTLAFAEDLFLAPFELFSGQKLGTVSDTALFNQWAKKLNEGAERIEQKSAANIQAGGKAAEVAHNLGVATIMAVPQAVAALLTSGTSVAAQTTAGLQTAANAALNSGIVNTINNVVGNMARDPQYWTAFASTVGNTYESGLQTIRERQPELSENELRSKAALYALGTSLMGAAVEVGGGIQKLPDEMQRGGTFWRLIADSAWDEGKEEVAQGIVDRAMQNLMLDRGYKLASLTDKDAVFSLPAAIEEGASGAAVGGILSGGQYGTVKAINNLANKAQTNSQAIPAPLSGSASAPGQAQAQLAPAASQTAQEAPQKGAAPSTVQEPGDFVETVMQYNREQQAAAQAQQNEKTAAESQRSVFESNTDVKSDDTESMRVALAEQFERGEITETEHNERMESIEELESLDDYGSGSLDTYNPNMMRKVEVNTDGRSSISDDGSQRAESQSAGEQAGALAEGTGRYQGRQVQSQRAAGRRDDVSRYYESRGQQPVSARDYLGTGKVNKVSTVQEMPAEMVTNDAELNRIAEEIRTMGLTPHFYVGDARLRNGNSVDGMIRGKDVYIRVDGDVWTATQNWDHEKAHAILRQSPGIEARLYGEIVGRGEAARRKLHRIMQRYREAYHGIYDMDENGNEIWDDSVQEMILQEILADAYAGKDTFAQGVEKYADVSSDAVSQIENRGGEVRGPPEGRLSMAGVNAKTADLDALSRAEEMERRGVDEETIFRDTGWIRGKDQKWRFEIDDSGMKYHRGGDAYFRRRYPEYNEFRELGVRQLYELGTESWTEQDQNRLLQLNEIWRSEPGRLSKILSDGDATLGYILEHSALFEAYPELEDVKVKFGELDAGERGHYNRSRNEIVLSDSIKRAPESTLLHEIQHAIQQVEGFSGGASPEFWAMKIKEEQRNAVEAADKAVRDIFDSMPADLKNKVRAYNRAVIDQDYDKRIEIDQELMESEYGDLFDAYLQADFDRRLLREHQENFDLESEAGRRYLNTAGEIEARETARRRKMTTEQRRESVPFRGDENTVFADGTVAYNAEIIPFRKQINDVLDGKTDSETSHLNMGTTPKVYEQLGFDTSLPVLITAKHVKNMNATVQTDDGHIHALSRGKIASLPRRIAEPVIVMRSKDYPDRIVVVTDLLNAKKEPVVVALQPDGTGNYMNAEIDANIALSGYGKKNFDNYLISAFSDGRIKFTA